MAKKKISKKTTTSKSKTNKFSTKELIIVGLIESLIFSIFVTCGNTYMFYQLFGTKYDLSAITVFFLQLPVGFIIFACFTFVYIIYIKSRLDN